MSAAKLSDIARLVGVSIATVSIALSNKQTTRVSTLKRARIQQIAQSLNYAPNEVARALAERRTRLLGLMVPLRDPIFFNQFIAQALSGIQSTLMHRGYNLLVYSPSGRPGRQTRDQILESTFTDGLIFINTRSCTGPDINQTIRELDSAKIQFVMINSYYGRAAINYVGVDDTLIGEAAGNYLISKGHKRVAFLSGSEKLPTHIHLLAGLKHALSLKRMALDPDMVACTKYEHGLSFATLDRWFHRNSIRPTAIFCADDQLLMQMYEYADARGLTIPTDVAVLGRGNAGFNSYLRPRPTTFVCLARRYWKLFCDDTFQSMRSHHSKHLFRRDTAAFGILNRCGLS